MSKKRKPGAGRKPLPAEQKKVQYAFRIIPSDLDAMRLLARQNDRSLSAEIVRACKSHIRRSGKM